MAGGPRSIGRSSARGTGLLSRTARRVAPPRQPSAAQANVEIVRDIFERWAAGDSGVDWADADIDFCGPDMRAGRGVEDMARLWGHWLESMDDFAVAPGRFLEAGDDEVLVPVRVICRSGARSPRDEVRTGVSLFRLSTGKVVSLSFFVDKPA